MILQFYHQLLESEYIRPLDRSLAECMMRVDPSTSPLILAAALLASIARTLGHSGFHLAQANAFAHIMYWPSLDEWDCQLRASSWVDCPTHPLEKAKKNCPLVYQHTMVFLRRYHSYECELATTLGQRMTRMQSTVSFEPMEFEFNRLFAEKNPTHNPQAIAALAALQRKFLLITGGPGTGKTTTVARLLYLCIYHAQMQGLQTPIIALTAPTGRAAERLAESMRTAITQLHKEAMDPNLLITMPTEAKTLHRLLDLRLNAKTPPTIPQPLLADIVIVDEVSMVDTVMMWQLTQRLADHTKLILLGDPDQLPSVDMGHIIRDLIQVIPPIPVPTATVTPRAWISSSMLQWQSLHFDGHRVHLEQSFRQSNDLHLAPLATAIREGNAETACKLLQTHALPGITFHDAPHDALERNMAQLCSLWSPLQQTRTPTIALAAMPNLRILTPLKEGRFGSNYINRYVESVLRSTQANTSSAYFHGRLIVITENSYYQQLFNGDIGVCIPDDYGNMWTWFRGIEPESTRAFAPSDLPAHESGFAITIHKSQGSEYDTVWLQLPENDHPLLTRELLYTAVTRARNALHFAGKTSILERALTRYCQRYSSLAPRLAASLQKHLPKSPSAAQA